MTRHWLIRLGKNGEYEAPAFRDNVLTVGFGIAEDISELRDRDSLIAKMAALAPAERLNRYRNVAAQVNQFVNVAQVGDLIARLRTREDIIDDLLATYDLLPEDIRAELPLRRTWTLVLDEAAADT